MTTIARDIELARFPRAGRGDVVISLRSFKGRLFVDARAHFHTPTGETSPTKKGVTFKTDEIAKLISALGRAQAMLKRGVR